MAKNDPGRSTGNSLSHGSERPLNTRLLLKLITIRRIRSIILQNRDFDVRVPLSLRLRAWRHWFSCRDWLLYDLDHRDPGEYLPHHASLDFALKHANSGSLNDKLLFARGLAAIGMDHPRPLAFMQRGRIHPFTGGEKDPPAGAWLAGQAARHGGIVLKPVIGLAGSGLLFIRESASGLTANGAAVTVSGLDELAAGLDQYLITEEVKQAAYAAAIFPQATNTLRILTLWDYQANEPFIAAAVHRFGSSRSLPVDNFHAGSGGLCANIDIVSGLLGPALTLDESGGLCRQRHHPETGAAIDGVSVPGWMEVRAAVLRVAAAFPESPFVGWDIALGENGPMFIEANVPPSIHVWQIHGGLLRDPRARAFFKAHGMLPRSHRPRRAGKVNQAATGDPRLGAGPGAVPKRRKRRRQEAAFPGAIPGKAYAGYPLPIRSRLNLRLVSWRRICAIHAANRNNPLPASLPVRLRAWRHGFSARHWALYDLDRSHPFEYVPDHAELNFGIRNANFRAPNDKLLFSRVLSSLGLRHPQILAFVLRGRLFPVDRSGKDRCRQGTWLAREAGRRGTLVLKPGAGPTWQGMILIQAEGQQLTANGRQVTPAVLDRMLAGLDQYLIAEHAGPASYAAAIIPSAANTVRVLTLWDYEANRPFVAAAVHRFALSRSALWDGSRDEDVLIAGLDLNSGRMGAAVALDGQGILRRHENHPCTHAAIAGVTVPRWAETLAAISGAAAALPQAPFLGWEIVVAEEGPCFLACCAPPDVWAWQIHGGLLRDPRIRTFLEAHRMVRPGRQGKASSGPVT